MKSRNNTLHLASTGNNFDLECCEQFQHDNSGSLKKLFGIGLEMFESVKLMEVRESERPTRKLV